jgi:hypothetical protein
LQEETKSIQESIRLALDKTALPAHGVIEIEGRLHDDWKQKTMNQLNGESRSVTS